MLLQSGKTTVTHIHDCVATTLYPTLPRFKSKMALVWDRSMVTNVARDRCISACVHVPYQESVLVLRVTNVASDRCISACVHVPYQESVLVLRVTNVANTKLTK